MALSESERLQFELLDAALEDPEKHIDLLTRQIEALANTVELQSQFLLRECEWTNKLARTRADQVEKGLQQNTG